MMLSRSKLFMKTLNYWKLMVSTKIYEIKVTVLYSSQWLKPPARWDWNVCNWWQSTLYRLVLLISVVADVKRSQ